MALIEKAEACELAIVSGYYDADLERIQSALNRRKAALATEKIGSLVRGQTIRLSQDIRPKFLAGCPVEVVDFIGDDSLRVSLLRNCGGRWPYGEVVTIKKNLIGATDL